MTFSKEFWPVDVVTGMPLETGPFHVVPLVTVVLPSWVSSLAGSSLRRRPLQWRGRAEGAGQEMAASTFVGLFFWPT